jgi:hypothetical protein
VKKLYKRVPYLLKDKVVMAMQGCGTCGGKGIKHRRVDRTERGLSVGRNELCPCGSGKKHKKCCMNTDDREVGRTPIVCGCVKTVSRDLNIAWVNI